MSKFLGEEHKFYKEYSKNKLESKEDEKIMTMKEFYADKAIVRKPIFEINCVQIDEETPEGCPVCPTCKEPTYSLDVCYFCGQHLKES